MNGKILNVARCVGELIVRAGTNVLSKWTELDSQMPISPHLFA